MNDTACMRLQMKSRARSAWNFLLQKGFYLRGPAGMTVRQFLVEVVGYDNRLIDESVRTIFLNSSPVDDIDSVHVKADDRLALGSAMPGLVGIVMGRDNPYKEFRSGIACQGDEGDVYTGESIRVFVKVFSTLAVDTGADILARGIEISAGQLSDFLEKHKAHLVEGDGLAELTDNPEKDVRVIVEFV